MDDEQFELLLWLRPLLEQVQLRLEELSLQEPDQRPAIEQEIVEIDSKISGWSQSLANPQLAPGVRHAIEASWTKASERRQALESLLSERNAQRKHVADKVDPSRIVECLDRLAEILSTNNPTMGNLELSLHIDRIDCFSDSRVVMRTCKLGTMADVIPLLATDDDAEVDCKSKSDTDGFAPVTPRRRARLRVDHGDGETKYLQAAADTAANPDRFAGLGDQWFWTDEFHIPERQSWAQEKASEVAEVRAKGSTMEQLAAHFGKTIPTIRAALRHASATGPMLDLPAKMPRRRWHEDHAKEVAELKAQGMGTAELARHFGKSDTTIRAALKHADGG